MSERWPGGIVRSTPVTPTGPLQNGTAPGIWTMEQAAYWTKQGLWPTAGNFLAVEDVFSTWLYTGNGSSQTITNGINLSGQGGMVWIKDRSAASSQRLYDTTRGANNAVFSNLTNAQTTVADSLTAFNSNGFTAGSANGTNGNNYASWTFREAANFFDVVTGTADGSGGFSFTHNLGSTPGMVILKNTNSGAGDWLVFHRSTGTSNVLYLNQTSAAANTGSPWINVSSTSVSSTGSGWFVGGATYVAYLYAHDTSSTGIIQCGSYTGAGSPYTGGSEVTLGWEPQWVLIKSAGNAANWVTIDNMRGWGATTDPTQNWLYPNTSGAENSSGNLAYLTPTGFKPYGSSLTNNTGTYIYIAIRRGPMRTPTLGTTVFSPIANTGNSTAKTLTTNFVTDLTVSQGRNAGSGSRATWWDRLRGPLLGVQSWTNTAEASYTATLTGFDNNTGVAVGADGTYGYINLSPDTFATWNFRRAPSFFDEVCYTGNASNRTINHNLGVAPELMIIKSRSAGGSSTYDWIVYAAPTWGTGAGTNNLLKLNTTISASFSNDMLNNTQPTSSVFSLGFYNNVNASGTTYVAYLFASCPGVSKVGSYTGNGSSQTINCGFTTGARFVLIKRTDSTGDWYVWDSARGIVAGNDPYLLLNSTAAEVTSNDSVDTDNSGFIVNQVAASDINVSAATYIYLAIS